MLALYSEQHDWEEGPAVVLSVPLKLVSEANQREHWSTRFDRKSEQQEFMSLVLPLAGRLFYVMYLQSIKLTRVGCKMDADNNVGSFKHVQDAIAKWLGADDGDVMWEYEQQTDADGCVGLRVTFQLERQT